MQIGAVNRIFHNSRKLCMRPHVLTPVTLTSTSRQVHLWPLKLCTKQAVYELLHKLRYLFVRHCKNVYSVKYCCISLIQADADGFIFFHINCHSPTFTFTTLRRFPVLSEVIPHMLNIVTAFFCECKQTGRNRTILKILCGCYQQVLTNHLSQDILTLS